MDWDDLPEFLFFCFTIAGVIVTIGGSCALVLWIFRWFLS